MILNTTDPIVGRTVSSLEIIADAGYPITTTGAKTMVAIRPTREARIASWGEIIHLRHHPSRELSVFADTVNDAMEVLAYEFHLWEVRESIRSAKRLRQLQTHSK